MPTIVDSMVISRADFMVFIAASGFIGFCIGLMLRLFVNRYDEEDKAKGQQDSVQTQDKVVHMSTCSYPVESPFQSKEQLDPLGADYEEHVKPLMEQVAVLRQRLAEFGDLQSMHGHIGDEPYHYVTYNGETWFNVLDGFMPANPDHIAYVKAWRAAIEKGWNPFDLLNITGTIILGKRPVPLDLNGDGRAQTPTGEMPGSDWGQPE